MIYFKVEQILPGSLGLILLEAIEVREEKFKERIQAGAPEPAFFKSFLCGAYPPVVGHCSGFFVYQI